MINIMANTMRAALTLRTTRHSPRGCRDSFARTGELPACTHSMIVAFFERYDGGENARTRT